MRKFYITAIFVLLTTKNIFSQLLFNQNGTAYNIEYKDDKITIFFNDNFQCSNIGPGGCYGINSLSTQYQMSRPFYSTNSTIFGVFKTNNIELVRGFTSSNDSSINPYVCMTRDTFTSCYFDDGKPTLGSSYMDDNNEMHYVGYVGSKVGICSNLPAHRLRYIKTSSQVFNEDNLTIIGPDSLLQVHDIEIFTNNINGYEYFDGFPTLILPTADQQSLVLYSSPVKDTIYDYYHKNSFSLLKLDADVNRTYAKNVFTGYYSDSVYLEYYITKHKKINNKIYIEGDAVKKINTSSDSTYTFLLELDANGILLTEQLKYVEWNHYNFIDSIENLNRDYEVFTTDTTTIINYYNAQRDTIRTITFPEKLNHNFVKTNNNKYLFVSYSLNNDWGYEAYLNVYDEHARRLKKEIIVDRFFMDYGYIQNAFLGVDTFQNVMFFYHQPTYGGGMACGSTYQKIETGFQNLDYMNFVSGNITQEIIQNCAKDSLEPPVKNILVELQLNGNTFYTYSDEAGKYRFASNDTGNAKVILHLSNQTAFTSSCQDTFNVVVSDTLENPVVNFFLQTPACNRPVPKVSVDITTPFLRRCFDNIYTLTLFNESADTAFNTFADITLDEDLIPVDTAFLAAQYLGNNTYRFSYGDLLPLQTIRHQLMVNVNCDAAILGETHCVKAVSYPYVNCIIADGQYLQALAACRNDSVIFTIQNIVLSENFSQNYRVLVNDSVKYAGTLNFTVSSPMVTLSYSNPAGNTYRLETCQYPRYANEDTILSVATEGCSNTGFTTGYITMFAQDDDQPNVSIDCHQNVGSYDPNDKSASPFGYGNSHLVENTETIEYTIRFQNLGTYPASFVTVIDTLSSDFDITTLKVIGASHDYQISIIDSSILKFIFYNIELVDAATDSLLSIGFIQFSIQPKANTAIGNKLKNNAFIIFDYNEAVETNTVQHEIGKDFLKVNIISVIKNNQFSDIDIKVYPNPASKQFTFELSKPVPENITLSVYTIDGKAIYSGNNLSLQNIIPTEKWPANLYLFELKNQTELLQSGKIIIE